jgi:hypothetical protein
MADYFEMKQCKKDAKGEERWTGKIGVAFPQKNGGFSLLFDLLPLPSLNDQGQLETRVVFVEPYDKDKPRVAGSTETKVDLDDEIPF